MASGNTGEMKSFVLLATLRWTGVQVGDAVVHPVSIVQPVAPRVFVQHVLVGCPHVLDVLGIDTLR